MSEPLIRKRSELPPLEKAVSDTLDEYLHRLFGITSGWVHPYEFLLWLGERGYIIHAKEETIVEQVE